MGLMWFLVGLAAGLLIFFFKRQITPAQDDAVPPTPALANSTDHAEPAEPTPASPPQDTPPESAHDRLHRLKADLEAQDDRIQRPSDLTALPGFQEAVTLLVDGGFSSDDVIHHLGGPGYVLPSIAASALPRRSDVSLEQALATAGNLGGFALQFLLDHLQRQPDATPLPLLMRHAREWWWDFLPVRTRLRQYLEWAEAHPGAATGAPLDDYDEDALQQLRTVLAKFHAPALRGVEHDVDSALSLRRERRVLSGFGRVMSRAGERTRFAHPELESALEKLHEQYTGATPKSVLVSGESGVGKTALIDLLADRLHAEGWLVFEASAAEILAGQKYIGELEQRVREMLSVLHRKRALWRVPDFFDLLHKGSHQQDPRGILDLLVPALERGELLLLGEITPRQLAQLVIARPSAKHHFDTIALQPPSAQALTGLASTWAGFHAQRLGQEVAKESVLAEAVRMAAQYFPEQHEPGRTLRLLDDALSAATVIDPVRLPLDDESLLSAIAARSGLPREVLDDRQSLDLDALRAFFRKRVIGQDEAVDCLIDRIAMLKAGLVDSSRPIGVFLFAGPTGTGKTELAKALGELLFGSGERLLRLDMSEYQSEDAAWRLTADDAHGGVRSLTSRIREQPFSVVLLDEFEKAHPKVWDLFLQVFDDARLTDRSGHTADFRHSIIILTSNAGATISRNASPGFTGGSSAGGYSRAQVEKTLFETFRREFLNRLDRIVLFNPLDRGLMREILHKELGRTLTRRGLRNRDWAVEWEPSAVEFLLDRGFTPDLGARPLRRAIEHHLLAPLARSIVEHRAPSGDQFLFVRSAGDRLEVQFVDPNATTTAATSAPLEADDDGDLRDLVFAPHSSPGASARLRARLSTLDATVTSPDWQAARANDYARMGEAEFWNDNGRFEVLDRIERRDRIESALATAHRLSQRIGDEGGDSDFVGRLAQLLWLLGLAIDALLQGRPQDALLEIAVSDPDPQRDHAETRLWWQQLLGMYLDWARRRNMRVDVLRQDPQRCSAWLALSGFGAFDLLETEAGLHVLEQELDDQPTRRLALQVQVSPDLPGRPRRPSSRDSEERRISRRYRAAPSPLVRDTARGWRSGRLDRVLSGEFDVIVDSTG